MNGVVIRAATKRDLPEVFRVTLLAEDQAAVVETLEPDFYSTVVAHTYETGMLRVAVEGDHLVGYAGSIVRDGARFLVSLFVLTSSQSKNLGRKLMDAVLPPAAQPVACMASSDPRALSLYIRRGLAPRWPSFDLELSTANLQHLGQPDVQVEIGTVGDAELLAWDTELSGRHRPEEHQFLVHKRGGQPLWFVRDGVRIGYGYAQIRAKSSEASLNGNAITLGPIGARTENDSLACVLAAVDWAKVQTELVTLEFPGPHPALKPLLDARAKIVDLGMFLATDVSPFGDPRLYVPSSGSFF